ncbi:MAG: hypothetical protein BWY76_02158 [bacterium ADurb.Bin429]|nr:MAG: hypothetical protein BWY76_02158 [bacterium ADurb.Bin429]
MNNRLLCRCLLPTSLMIVPALAWGWQSNGVAFPSTPFMPPRGFEWVPVLFGVLFVITNMLLLRYWWKIALGSAFSIVIGIGVGAMALGLLLVPQLYCWYTRDLHWGGTVFWAWSWSAIGVESLTMNGLSLTFILASAMCLAYHHPERPEPGIPRKLAWGIIAIAGISLYLSLPLHDNVISVIVMLVLLLTAGIYAAAVHLGARSFVLLGVNGLVYLVCFLPYVFTGAYAHGMAPWQECQHQLSWGTGSALIAYTRAHNGRLPTGRAMPEVLKELHPYYIETMVGTPGGYGESYDPLYCKAGCWRDRQPKPYAWNAVTAGKTMDELRALRQPIKIITCPYHAGFYIDSSDLLEAYDDPQGVHISL